MKILVEGCCLLDAEAEGGLRRGVNILIDGGRIASVSTMPVEADVDRRIDGRDRLVMPGIVNAHTHSPENLFKATTDRLPFEAWLVHSIWMMDGMTPRDHYLAAMLGVIEMLRSGTTAVMDHVGIPPEDGPAALDAVMEAYRVSGLRAGVAPLFRQVPNDVADAEARGFPLASLLPATLPPGPSTAERLDLLGGFFARWHGTEGGRLRCFVGPSGVQWFTPALLHDYAALAASFGSGMHMHLMETRVQDQVVRALHGKTAVALLADEKLLGPHVSLPHSVWITQRDVERIAEAGAVPVHNPAANLRLGSGLSPIRAMLDAGIVPGLGADGSKSSDHQNMFGHIHLAALIHNLADPDPDRWLASREVLRMAGEGGAAVLMRRGELGRIEPGFLADLTLLDLAAPAFAPLHDAFHHLAYCELGGAVRTVIIDGRIVMDEGRILTFDADAIIAEARERMAERALGAPPSPDWQAAIDAHRAYQQHILATTAFEQD